MSEAYPLPDYACSIWTVGDHLMVAFPGTRSEQGHTIKLPISEAGLKTALSILRARATAPDLRLGNKGTPSQWEAEKMAAWGKAMKADKDAKIAKIEADKAAVLAERAEAEAFLKELGL